MLEIGTIGFEIPGNKNYIEYEKEHSLSDFDVVFFGKQNVYINKIIEGTPFIVDKEAKNFLQMIQHRKSEIDKFTSMGKNVYIMLGDVNEFSVESGRSHRGNTTIYSGTQYNNFSFLPKNFSIRNGIGKNLIVKNQVFKEYLEFCTGYSSYLDLDNDSLRNNSIFVSKDGLKALGQIYPHNSGNIIFLPAIDFEKDEFIENDGKHWSKKGLQIGKNFLNFIAGVDKSFKKEIEKTPEPNRIAGNTKFLPNISINILKEIKQTKNQLKKYENKLITLNNDLSKSNIILDLLYEKGKPLEYAVRYALEILGFEAEGYDDGTLELDQVITSPEGIRYIGECEGKDDKAIHIEKIRQLRESIDRDFERDDINERAKGILFGNPQRLRPLQERNEDFTKKLLVAADNDHIILIKTCDLFFAVKYILDTNNEDYKKTCRESISNCKGGIFEFPKT